MGDVSRVRIMLLGPCRSEIGGAEVAMPARKERMALATLALRPGRPLGVHELAAVLWGEPLPDAARKSAQAVASRLRRRLAAAAPGIEARFVTHDDGYTLRVEPADVDAFCFERLVDDAARALHEGNAERALTLVGEATALWRGDPVPELADSALGQIEAARLTGLRVRALELWNDAELGVGRNDPVIGRTEGLLAEEPFRENLWAQLMLALYRSGRQAEALRAYQRARAALVDQLGIEPGAELRQLEAAIVTQAPELDLGTLAPSIPGPAPRVAPPPLARRPDAGVPDWVTRSCVGPFVDRQVEIARIESAFDAAASGVRVVGVSGEDGIGKSRLVAEAARRFAEAGALVLGGQCHTDRSSLAPFRHLLDRYAAQAPSSADDWTTGAAATLGALSSVMAEQLGGTCRPDLDDPYAAASGVLSLVRAAGHHRPTVLVLDDLHLADPSTIEAVRQLVDGYPDVAMLVVLVFRGADARLRPELLDLLDDLHRLPGYERIPLGPLPSDDGAALLAELLGGPVGVHWERAFVTLNEEVGGKPRYLLALARAVADRRGVEAHDWVPAGLAELGLPRSLHDLIRRNLRALPVAYRGVLDAAAVVDSPFGVGSVADLAGCSIDTVLAALDWLRVAGLVVQSDLGTAAFSCEAVRRAVRDDLAPAHLLRLRARRSEPRTTGAAGRAGDGTRPLHRELFSTPT